MKSESLEEKNLSHHQRELSFEARVQEIRDKIIDRGDLPYSSVDKQLDLLKILEQSDLGRFLIERGGVNGYWTDQIVRYPCLPNKPKMNAVEEFLFSRSPVVLATRQRYQIFKAELQKKVAEGAVLASIPCGVMGDLLELDFSNVSEFSLVGMDIDPDALLQAKQLAKKVGLIKNCEFLQKDAWDLNIKKRFDVLTSNGLSIYEMDDERVVDLYREFFEALKPGGYLITSFLTPPPIAGQLSEWRLEKIIPEDLLMQKILLADILNCKFQIFRSSEKVKDQLMNAGFESIEFFHDEASIFPTVMARRRG